jgi:diaminohydroxyphosphoribosylaminopyrimidine deaminase/5-amino-6-(5-phosphoribosylamino)uracil reductase
MISDKLWDEFLKLKCLSRKTDKSYSTWLFDGSAFYPKTNNEKLDLSQTIAILSTSKNEFTCISKSELWCCEELLTNKLFIYYKKDIKESQLSVLKLYWPISVISCIYRKSLFLIVHLAQTIDGKIATVTGDSQWIGNKENLVHAHRLRALVDGIMVGGNTVKIDKPKLNVRHVKGKDPIRLILSNKTKTFVDVPCSDSCETLLVRSADYRNDKPICGISRTIYYQNKEGSSSRSIKETIKNEGIHSVLLEGGAQTIKLFLEEFEIDLLQIHIAPIIFGSGKSGLILNEISKLKDAINLENSFSTLMGNAIMITGEIKQ